MWIKTVETEIRRLELNYLVHSYLYYIVDEPIVDDGRYDKICKDLVALIPFSSVKYDITKGLGSSGSGFYIKENQYPDEVKTKAMMLLYWRNGNGMKLEDFLSQYGKRIIS